MTAARPDEPLRLRFLLLLAAVALGLAGALLAPTLRAPFAPPDAEYVRLAAGTASGRTGLLDAFAIAHSKRLVPVLFACFQANAALFGGAAAPLRAAVLLLHAASGFLVGLLAFRSAGRTAGLVAAALWIAPVGALGATGWLLSRTAFSLGVLGLLAALAALAFRDALGRLRAETIALLGVALLLASERVLLPMVAAPILLDGLGRGAAGDNRSRPSRFSLIALALAAAALLGPWLLSARSPEPAFETSLRSATRRAATAAATVPFRLLFPDLVAETEPGAPLPLRPAVYGLAIAAVVGAAAVALAPRGESRLVRDAAVAGAAVAAVFAFAVLRRSSAVAFDQDLGRAGELLLFPGALLAGAIASTAGSRLRESDAVRLAALLGVSALFAAATLFLHRYTFVARRPSAAAASPGSPSPPSSAVPGIPAVARVSDGANFRVDAGAAHVVSGFHGWEKSFRWMSRQGELRLPMTGPWLRLDVSAPIPTIRAAAPEFARLLVEVTLVHADTGEELSLGAVSVDDAAERGFDLDARRAFARWGAGRVVYVRLTSDRTWRGADVLPGSEDRRELSVALLSARFQKEPSGGVR